MKTSRLLFSLIAVACSLRAGEPGAKLPKQKDSLAQNIPDGVEVIRDVAIGTGGGKTLHVDIARPKNPPAAPMPAVLWIHGGGWSGGTHRDNRAMPLATAGYFTASVEYRLSGEAHWPAQIEDCKLAVRWLRANAASYRVDPDRIGCWGTSAGGHLVAFLGVTADQPEFEGKGGYAGVSSRVQAVVDFWGPVDMTAGSLGIQRATGDHDAPAPLGLAGAPFKEKPEIWRQMSPVIHVSAKAAPFFIVHGDRDETVPIVHSERLKLALQRAGVPVDYLVVKGAGHSLQTKPGDPPPTPDRAAVNKAVREFFDRHLKR